jgi:hypothetical protein
MMDRLSHLVDKTKSKIKGHRDEGTAADGPLSPPPTSGAPVAAARDDDGDDGGARTQSNQPVRLFLTVRACVPARAGD